MGLVAAPEMGAGYIGMCTSRVLGGDLKIAGMTALVGPPFPLRDDPARSKPFLPDKGLAAGIAVVELP